jgi:hypothetical protein
MGDQIDPSEQTTPAVDADPSSQLTRLFLQSLSPARRQMLNEVPSYWAEDEAEVTRLLVRHRILCEAMGGLLPPGFDYVAFKAQFQDRHGSYYRGLDVGCSAGGWVTDVMRSYPGGCTFGIDTDTCLIEQAQARADLEGLDGAYFTAVPDLFPSTWPSCLDHEYHLIRLSHLAGRVSAAHLPELLRSLVALCHKKGRIVWTEVEFPITNCAAYERFSALLLQALRVTGRTFTPGPALGITPLMSDLLTKAGCKVIGTHSFSVDLAATILRRRQFADQVWTIGKRVRPFVLQTGITTEQEYNCLFFQALQEFQFQFQALTRKKNPQPEASITALIVLCNAQLPFPTR